MVGLVTYGAARLRSKAALAILMVWGAVAQAEPVEIVALGDSLTQGYGLPTEDGFVPQMQAWLSARGHEVTLVNAGVSGDTTAGGLSRVDWSLSEQTDALIVTLGGNDLLRGLPPENARANLDGILQAAQRRELPVLLVGLDAPGNYGPAYKEAFDAIYPDLAHVYGALLFDNFFSGLQENGAQPADLSAYMQADGIHPNAAGLLRIVAAMGPEVEALIQRAQD
ncbi:arylesterase [Puniceibacterium sp. IMCC21224]|uniref:arylesterase n=1 Tax=Puniceibacterium sp. IMCC21224 TaxID=1618204 RepID=UPI00064E126C|nr:arylesterase [Puniceibacterium sp. IMCC21224]KMK65703.1 lysophospholipase L1-like esterase [Puniceibacterium sp. IMCC21224]